jgi:hypothetical protein
VLTLCGLLITLLGDWPCWAVSCPLSCGDISRIEHCLPVLLFELRIFFANWIVSWCDTLGHRHDSQAMPGGSSSVAHSRPPFETTHIPWSKNQCQRRCAAMDRSIWGNNYELILSIQPSTDTTITSFFPTSAMGLFHHHEDPSNVRLVSVSVKVYTYWRRCWQGTDEHHKVKLSHEVMAGTAAYGVRSFLHVSLNNKDKPRIWFYRLPESTSTTAPRKATLSPMRTQRRSHMIFLPQNGRTISLIHIQCLVQDSLVHSLTIWSKPKGPVS